MPETGKEITVVIFGGKKSAIVRGIGEGASKGVKK